jgi:hypothetical protein
MAAAPHPPKPLPPPVYVPHAELRAWMESALVGRSAWGVRETSRCIPHGVCKEGVAVSWQCCIVQLAVSGPCPAHASARLPLEEGRPQTMHCKALCSPLPWSVCIAVFAVAASPPAAAAGADMPSAAAVADALILASLRGTDTHGITIFHDYVRMVRAGGANGRPNFRVRWPFPSIGVLDADAGLGIAAGKSASAHAHAHTPTTPPTPATACPLGEHDLSWWYCAHGCRSGWVPRCRGVQPPRFSV